MAFGFQVYPDTIGNGLLNYDDMRGKIYDKKLNKIRKMTKKEKAERFLGEAIGKKYEDEIFGNLVTGSGINIKTNQYNNFFTTYS